MSLENNYIEITESEVVDEFYNHLSEPLIDLLSDLKEKMYKSGYPILNNPTKTAHHDFLELILYNIKLETLPFYQKKNIML